jgi:excisionase family DNA binding protein
MGRVAALEERLSEERGNQCTGKPASVLEPKSTQQLSRVSHGVEALLTSNEAALVLKIHPKVLERMAKRGEVPALKVGKFWRYRASALDAWINSRLQSRSQVCRIATSF